MDTNYNSLLEKNLANAHLFVEKRGFKKSLYEYLIILSISLSILFFGSFLSKTIGQVFLRYTHFNIIEFIFKFLPLFIFLYLWTKHKFKLKEILSIFGLYEESWKRTIKNIIVYFTIVLLLIILLTTIFMTPPIYISSKLAKIANDQNAVLNWESPIIDVFKEYYNQIYRVAILEEMFFRGYIQYFLFFLLVYYFRNVAKSEDKRVNKLIYQPVIFLVPIIISVLIFMLYHNFYLESSLQVSSSMYKVTLLIYLLGSIISALIINRTGNLWLAIFFHAGWNALQFISNLLLFSNYSIIINFLGSIMLSNQVPREIVDQIVLLIVSIVS